ncbi:hypothetical protein ElyMa_001927900 [Elysia marginata]|uniref:Uncharacterized protein n=1 Tax=Elysia marginata TaxID=1093978 RepID=A0AAV4EVV1_9GAST|nr:hypothetical protein ElyMa_001927900 [Elysia marginata]
MEQPSHPIAYKEAKIITKNKFHHTWQASNRTLYNRKNPSTNSLVGIKLQSSAFATVFRLRTKYCRLLNHDNRLGVSHTDRCPCGCDRQDVEHVLHHSSRAEKWPTELSLQQKLGGNLQYLLTTGDFIGGTDILV